MKQQSVNILIIFYVCILPFNGSALTPEFKIKTKPLFETLNIFQSPVQKKQSILNPIYKQEIKSAVFQKEKKNSLFEYKVSAIWQINNTYKALIAGHIVSVGDQLNTFTIIKINPKEITVKHKETTKKIPIGVIFYDFQS